MKTRISTPYQIVLTHCTTLEQKCVELEFKSFDSAFHYAKYLETLEDSDKWVITKIEFLYDN